MFRSRRRLRVPAALASLFWLLGGVTDAAGVEPCPHHGGAAHGAETPPASAPDRSVHADHTGASSHAGHGSHSEHAAGHLPQASASSPAADGSHGDEHGCDCGPTGCVGAAKLATPEAALTEGLREPGVRVEGGRPTVEEVGTPTTLLPFFLPPSIAPPSA